MAGFEAIREQLVATGLLCDMWIDGSFLTEKIDPGDIDIVLMMPRRFEHGTPEQNELMEWLLAKEDDPKKSFLCHVFVELDYEESHPWHHLTVGAKRHYGNIFGFSVSKKEPKGIAVLTIEEPLLPEKETLKIAPASDTIEVSDLVKKQVEGPALGKALDDNKEGEYR